VVRAQLSSLAALVVAYALRGAGPCLTSEPLGNDSAGKPVYLKDIWPTPQEMNQPFVLLFLRRNTASNTAKFVEAMPHGSPCHSQRRYYMDPKSTYISCRRFREYAKDASPVADIRGAKCWPFLATASRPITFRRPDHSCRLACWKVPLANGVKRMNSNLRRAPWNHES